MRLHLAAVYANDMDVGGQYYRRLNSAAQLHRREVRYILESYHYFNKPAQAERLRKSGERVFLDSGAFSAWSQGVQIDLAEYCKFAQVNRDLFTAVAVLDVIGSAEATWENQKKMEAAGVRPLPCFHYGEDTRYCDFYAANYDYMALGGFGVANRRQIEEWLDMIWEHHLTDAAGRPRCKVHGFAMTALPLMQRYPWFSADSSSWLQLANNGHILDPDLGMLTFGDGSSLRKVDGQHYDNLPEIVQRQLATKYAELGYSVDELRTSYLARRTFCLWSYCEMERRMNGKAAIFINDRATLFDG